MELIISRGGLIRCLYAEAIPLAALGALQIQRASYVEPDAHGQWMTSLLPVAGPILGPFPTRSQALAAEAAWLSAERLAGISH